MGRVRARVKDKRVLGLVKAFLKAGVLTETGGHRDTLTGTPQGGILSADLQHSPQRARSVRVRSWQVQWQAAGTW
jgi:RNA-directed DNA polymerase